MARHTPKYYPTEPNSFHHQHCSLESGHDGRCNRSNHKHITDGRVADLTLPYHHERAGFHHDGVDHEQLQPRLISQLPARSG